MTRTCDALAATAALIGGAGVVLAAADAHAGGGDLGRTASDFLLLHAGALIGVSAVARAAPPRRARRLLLAGGALACGVALFSADIAARGFLGTKLFPFAAPIGGSLTILAWFALAGLFALPE